MSSWRRTNLSLAFGPLDTLLDGLRATAEVTRQAVDPLLALLDTVSALFDAVEPSVLDIDFLLQYLFAIEYVHLYPNQPYQALRRDQWMQQAASILTSRGGHCVTAPYHLFVFAVSAPNFVQLRALASGLEGVFDNFSLGVDDSPVNLDRSQHFDTPLQCASLADLVPVLDELAQFLDSIALQESAGSIGLMRDVLQAKLTQLTNRIRTIDALLARVASIPDPEVWVFDCAGIETTSGLTSALLGSQGGPEATSFMAGTLAVTGQPGGVLLGGLLGGL